MSNTGIINTAVRGEIIRDNLTATEDIPGQQRELPVDLAAGTQVRRYEPTRRGFQGDLAVVVSLTGVAAGRAVLVPERFVTWRS